VKTTFRQRVCHWVIVDRSEVKPLLFCDFEGVCLIEAINRLLVACKEHGEKEKRDYIYVYSFSLSWEEYNQKPIFKIKRNKVHHKFKPSGIAIHPNGNIYILSSVSKSLLVISTSGDILEIYNLNPSIFNQPEGITFTTEGDLYVVNEKKSNGPTLLYFKRIENK